VAARDKKGRWLPGQSPNPAGRAKDSGLVGKLRNAIRHRLPGIVEKLVEQAEAGDVQAARVLVERVLPALRPEAREIVVDVPADSLTARAQALVDAALAGQVPANVASELIAALANVGKLQELTEFEARLRKLEESLP
jgi:hypothetical protein